MERGLAAAIASIVVSWKTMNGAIESARARAVRQARSAFDKGDRSAGSTFDPRALASVVVRPPFVAMCLAAGMVRGTRPSRNRERARRPSRPVGPAREVAHDSQRYRRARVMPT